MTEDEVRAAAERLVDFHERFAPLFGKEQAQDHAHTYVGPPALLMIQERRCDIAPRVPAPDLIPPGGISCSCSSC